MSFTYSRALVGAYLEGNSSVIEQFAPLKSSLTQEPFLWHDKTMVLSLRSQFGMMCEPLTENIGAELLMWFVEDFRAKTLARQEKAQELMESEAECGEKWRGSFAKYNQDTLSWKTHQCSLLGGLDEFSETWPQWGLMHDGECWEQQTLERTIRGTESGFSPNGMDTFHTPNTTGLDGGSNGRKALKKKMQKLPTPTAHNAKENNSPSELMRNTPTLATHAGGKLNPNWVECLMGWHIGQTDLKPLGTDKSHFVQQQHLPS